MSVGDPLAAATGTTHVFDMLFDGCSRVCGAVGGYAPVYRVIAVESTSAARDENADACMSDPQPWQACRHSPDGCAACHGH